MKQWLKEPLFHFLLIGVGIFLLYGLTANEIQKEHKRIEITTTESDRLVALWEKRWNRPPTQKEFEGLLKQTIRQEILYHEALAMGLDKDDAVVRQRLAQKLEFISNDIMTIDIPKDEVLQAYLDTHAQKYQIPGSITFRHIFFNLDKDSYISVSNKINRLLASLNLEESHVDIQSAGDVFLQGMDFKDQSVFEIDRIFGKSFREKLFQQTTGIWVGPIESGFGLHLVRIDDKVDSKKALLEDVRASVLRDWTYDERKKINDAFIEGLQRQYEIVVAKTSKKLLTDKGVQE